MRGLQLILVRACRSRCLFVHSCVSGRVFGVTFSDRSVRGATAQTANRARQGGRRPLPTLASLIWRCGEVLILAAGGAPSTTPYAEGFEPQARSCVTEECCGSSLPHDRAGPPGDRWTSRPDHDPTLHAPVVRQRSRTQRGRANAGHYTGESQTAWKDVGDEGAASK
jgi:hypothetical protein